MVTIIFIFLYFILINFKNTATPMAILNNMLTRGLLIFLYLIFIGSKICNF